MAQARENGVSLRRCHAGGPHNPLHGIRSDRPGGKGLQARSPPEEELPCATCHTRTLFRTRQSGLARSPSRPARPLRPKPRPTDDGGAPERRRISRRGGGPSRADTAAGLLDELRAQIARFVILPSQEALDAITLWVAATHLQPAWQHAPRLAVVARRSGAASRGCWTC